MVCCAFYFLIWDGQLYHDLFLSYTLFMYVIDAGFSFGKNETFEACCEKDEPYNVDLHIFCIWLQQFVLTLGNI